MPDPKTIRICHLGKYYAPAIGGIETHVQTLARAQSRLGAEVRVLCINHQSLQRGQTSGNAVVTERDCRVQIRRLRTRGRFARADFCANARNELLRLSREQMDIFHLHAPNPTMMLALASIAPQTPLVVTHHSDIVRQKLLYKLFHPFEQRVLKRASRILATSAAYCSGSSVLSRYSDKVEVCPFGVDLNPFLAPSAAALKFEQRLRDRYGKPLWLSVSRLVYYKGLEVGIQALRRVPGRWMVVGSGALEEKLRAEATRHGVANRIVWKSHLTDDELAGAYRAATALWFPSNFRSEAFGLVQVEAMASGCPVINCEIRDSGVPWVSRHDETGLTVPINDAVRFADAAARLLDTPGLRDRLVAGAKARAIREFDHRIMAARSLEIYKEILRQKTVERRRHRKAA